MGVDTSRTWEEDGGDEREADEGERDACVVVVAGACLEAIVARHRVVASVTAGVMVARRLGAREDGADVHAA